MKSSIDNFLKICGNCPNRFFNLNGKGSLFRPLIYKSFVKKGDIYKLQDDKLSPAEYFIFGEDEYEDVNDCLRKENKPCKYKCFCNCSNFIFTNNKSISIHRRNFFYKSLSRIIQKGHIKMQIKNTCPYFMEFLLMKINAKQTFKNIIINDA